MALGVSLAERPVHAPTGHTICGVEAGDGIPVAADFAPLHRSLLEALATIASSRKAMVVDVARVCAWKLALALGLGFFGLFLLLALIYFFQRKAQFDPEHRLHRNRCGRCLVAAGRAFTKYYEKSPLAFAPRTVGTRAPASTVTLTPALIAGSYALSTPTLTLTLSLTLSAGMPPYSLTHYVGQILQVTSDTYLGITALFGN